MSLNGLDDQKIKEAHDTAVAEPGGWFLLKYISRDEVELLGRGNGGIVEIRNAIAQYEEPSPLFGFLRYRRRNVLIKYVPEECSRLVQARVTVHFNAVTERFSPHDTVFPIATSKELRDTTLSAACSLHTASGSTSSSTSSLRRRRLMEIAEDAEEEVRAKRQSTVPEERPQTAKTGSVTGTQPLSPAQPELPPSLVPSTNHQPSTEAEASLPPRDTHLPEIRSRSPTRLEGEPRKSSQSTRPEIYSYASYSSSGRPKVKLGPRPSLDVGGRPHTSGAASFYRPVSTLPPGLKLFSKGSKKDKDRPKSQYTSDTPSMTLSPPPIPNSMMNPTQEVPARPHTSGGRSTVHSGSFMKPLPSPTFSTAPKTPGITPERARLLKAMELRKKQMSAKVAPPQDIASPPPSEQLSSPVSEGQRLSNGAPKVVHDTLVILDDMAKVDDSAIAFDARSTLKTDESDATRSDSYPVSPVGPSERAESTRASSISESTDETVQEPVHAKEVADQELDLDEQKVETEVRDEPENITQESTDIPLLKPEEHQAPSLALLNPVSTPSEIRQLEPSVEEMPTLMEDSESAQLPNEVPPAESSTAAVEDSLASPDTSYPVKEIVIPVAEQLAQPLVQEAQLERESIPSPVSPVKQMKIPRSKFSVQDLRAVDIAPEQPTAPLPSSNSRSTMLPAEKSPVASSFSDRSLAEDGQPKKRQKRKGIVEPIRTDLDLTDRSGANSDAHFSDDDDLMDELSSAVVEEAKPISVSKSPISPVFPSPKKQNRFSRVFSAPMRKESSQSSMLDPSDANKSTPQRSPSRSVSAAASYLNRINQEPAKPIAKTVNLGSGISQRIKALEKLSSSATPPPGSTAPPPGTSTAFFSVRKASIQAPSKSPSIAERANSLTRNSPSPSVSRDSSPETLKIRERSGSIQNRLDAFKSSSTPTPAPRSRPESISVTARIIRDPDQPFPAKSEAGKDPADYTPLNLKQSPLIIDHQKAIVEPPKETIQERRLSKERRLSNASKSTTKERRSSITIIKDLISDRRTSFSERRRSINLEISGVSSPGARSPSRPPSVHASPAHHRPMSISSRKSTSSRDPGNGLSPPLTANSLSSNGEDKPDKKSGRASRMMRRMSSSLSAGRKQIAAVMSPTVREENEPIHGSDSQSLTPSYPSNSSMSSVSIGDVNVQFPDSLLWKRRSVLLDSQGFLLLSPALTAHGSGRDKSAGGALRRFHLSEFRTPCIPDVEMQELPNSVVLDFVEGGGLQVACEDRAGQARVLQSLLLLKSQTH
ncbi:uncharacterized protein LY89DRAFT_681244 [Mollisia scopiformis]|uniref:ADF-H domain-containing protein n=1 Tax=Mollisia scopiformis TaxID=149040 RepID=A0A194XQ46_MOLSC|nr:uncharacterized protein LY89DRAFT_681244 [Mollisia scopiformis]KUJ21867.1 hypothetical protein LY89DRAFT_681244 [Mollisia scopiformis]